MTTKLDPVFAAKAIADAHSAVDAIQTLSREVERLEGLVGALEDLAYCSQTALTLLDSGDVIESGSPAHNNLRKAMDAYRAVDRGEKPA